MTTNIYLDNLLKPLCNSYGGCFSSDTIPSLSETEERNFIVNLSTQKEEGTHFICLIVTKNSCYYFDSFGMMCRNRNILSYMRTLKRKVYYNKQIIQDITSQFCGFYCALICLRNDSNFHHVNFDMKFFPTQRLRNDALCVKYICQTLRKGRKRQPQ